LLVELDRRDFQLQLDAARAALSSARARQAEASAKLERAQRLSKAQYVSEDELLTRETALAVSAAEILNAEAQVAIAQRQLDKCGVFAPFDGVVQERMAQQGAYVTVGTPLLQLTQTGLVELDAEVPAVLAESLQQAMDWYFVAGEQRWDVTLLRLSPVIQAGRRARPARFAFDGEPPPAGQNGELVWRVAGGQLPANLISRRQGELGVFLVESGAARFLPLPGAQEGRPVPVELPAGALVIVQGQDRLQDGDPVQVR
jgi:RND family efflux transporter MFP subunit